MARITARIASERGEDALVVSAANHGGAGSGYEFTWSAGKLYFAAMKVRYIRIHKRTAYNSEVHASRGRGVGELNNCDEDAQFADTIFVAVPELTRNIDGSHARRAAGQSTHRHVSSSSTPAGR